MEFSIGETNQNLISQRLYEQYIEGRNNGFKPPKDDFNGFIGFIHGDVFNGSDGNLGFSSSTNSFFNRYVKGNKITLNVPNNEIFDEIVDYGDLSVTVPANMAVIGNDSHPSVSMAIKYAFMRQYSPGTSIVPFENIDGLSPAEINDLETIVADPEAWDLVIAWNQEELGDSMQKVLKIFRNWLYL